MDHNEVLKTMFARTDGSQRPWHPVHILALRLPEDANGSASMLVEVESEYNETDGILKEDKQ